MPRSRPSSKTVSTRSTRTLRTARTAQSSPSRKKRSCKKTPYVENKGLFNTHGGRVTSSCHNCFPIVPHATTLCASECMYPSDHIMQFMRFIYDNKVPTRKVFVVGYGPPASGKSRIITSLNSVQFKDLHVTHSNTIEMNVDDVFQSKTSPLYYGDIKHRLNRTNRLTISDDVRNARLYSTYRHMADQLNDAVYWKSLALGYNIYFETTGWSVDWVNQFIHTSHRAGYTCVVCYPYVDTPALIERILARSNTQIGRSIKHIQESVQRAQSNVKALAIDPEFGDRFIVFDNRQKEDTLQRQMPILYCGDTKGFSIRKVTKRKVTKRKATKS